VDDTGNTRWLIYNVEEIDWNYSTNIDIDRVWSQAYHYYQCGERGQLTSAEVDFQTLNNIKYEIRTPEHEFIMEHFKPTLANEGEFWTVYKILEYFQKHTEKPFQINSMSLGRALKQLGFEPDRKFVGGFTHRGYWLKPNGRPNFITGRPHGLELPDGMTEEEADEQHFYVSFSYKDKIYKQRLTANEVAFHRGVYGFFDM
jgi:hypothetical protein